MSSVILAGDTSGSVTVTVPAVAGSNTATIGAATGTHYPFPAGTAVASTSGTSIDFTSIPSWVKRITVMFNGVSTNGTSNVMLQIGTSSGIETTGYLGSCGSVSFAPSGFGITFGTASSSVAHGIAVITKIDGNSWVYSVSMGYSSSAASGAGGGSKTLSGTLDRVRMTTYAGTDTFDAGSINILYE